jgi:toxin YoeB
MRLIFEREAIEDFRFWLETDRRKALKIFDLVKASMSSPFEGIGKPEPLKFGLSGFWSRRIDQEHRLVYKVAGDDLIVIGCRYHYE